MDTPARSQSPHADIQVKNETSSPVQHKISAYYSLVFPHFTFYVQTLSITIGRRCAPGPQAASSSTSELVQVDVDLGALKSVSRLHAKIEYDYAEDRFVLAVIGRNGAWVDGVWCASGSRTPLGERSQLQIASRVFQFILPPPPPPPPEDSPSPGSHSSRAARHRSPSLDIETISPPSSQPPNSPPLIEHKLPSPPPEPHIKHEPPPQSKLPNSNLINKPLKARANRTAPAAITKKRKKRDIDSPPVLERPKPEDMPPKPPFTYAQLIYKAIKAIDGKATLQEICTWILRTYDYYKYADSSWMSSVRHNLSSGRAFLKMERCGGDRGKGFFWSIDQKYARAFEEQESKAQQAPVNGSGPAGGKDGATKGRKKDKALPPPLTNTPLTFRTTNPAMTTSAAIPASNGGSASMSTTGCMSTLASNGASPPATGIFAYPARPQSPHAVTLQHSSGGSNPYAALTKSHWNAQRSIPETHSVSTAPLTIHQSAMTNIVSSIAGPKSMDSGLLCPSASPLGLTQQQPVVPDVVIPIVLGSIPPTHPDYSPSRRNNSAKEGYMILHERKLILDPDVFSELTPEMLTELERMGARAALAVLTGHMVRALKEKRARERERGKGREKGSRQGRGGRKGATNVVSNTQCISRSPFTEALLERAEVTARSANIGGGQTREESQSTEDEPREEGSISMAPAEPGSPIIVVVDSEDEGPVAKKRKVDDDKERARPVLDGTALVPDII